MSPARHSRRSFLPLYTTARLPHLVVSMSYLGERGCYLRVLALHIGRTT